MTIRQTRAFQANNATGPSAADVDASSSASAASAPPETHDSTPNPPGPLRTALNGDDEDFHPSYGLGPVQTPVKEAPESSESRKGLSPGAGAAVAICSLLACAACVALFVVRRRRQPRSSVPYGANSAANGTPL
jgi:hypothetical protein